MSGRPILERNAGRTIFFLFFSLIVSVYSFNSYYNKKLPYFHIKKLFSIDQHAKMGIDFINDNRELFGSVIFTNGLELAKVDFPIIFTKAYSKALDGGTAGASAAVIQVLSFMWLRTVMNYQYRYGTTTLESLQTLYAAGGIARLYQGLPFAIIQVQKPLLMNQILYLY